MKETARRFTIGPIAHLPPERPRRTRPLDPVSENRLVAAAKTGDVAARAELLEALAPSIRSMSRHYSTSTGAGHPELMQAGAAGLLQALERYDVEGGTPFWAYASWWARHAMQSHATGLAHPVAPRPRA
jgi:DNA-directed RNA polymerase specialized sigma subunit